MGFPRVAFFTDTFDQINGVALTSRQFVRYAERHQLPFLCVREGRANRVRREGDELVEMLRARTGKPVFLMKRGIDTELFHPARRTVSDGILRLGYVGRITPEKNVRFLRELELGLKAAGVRPFRFLIIGDGSEKSWLITEMENAELPGIHRDEELARDYANMDVFVFPSRTDTFGNVVLEAFASGVPAVVANAGGPRFIVREGVSGFVAASNQDFIARTVRILNDRSLQMKMGEAAREQAMGESWDDVFGKVYEGYATVLAPAK